MSYLGVIGGSSFLKSTFFTNGTWSTLTEDTPYGKLQYFLDADRGVVFVQRHHADPAIDYSPPHLINKKAIIWGMQQLGCTRVVAFCSTGAMNPAIQLGSVVVPHDFLCLNRINFKDDYSAHNIPGFDEDLRNELLECLRENNINHVPDAVYFQSEGPRFETAAEIRLFAQVCDVVGMTAAQEAVLAREVKLPYAAVCMVDNIANGIKQTALTFDDFHGGVKNNQDAVDRTLSVVLAKFAPSPSGDATPDVRTKVDKIVHGRWVIPMHYEETPDQRVLERHSIVVAANGDILDVLPTKEVSDKYVARTTTDLSQNHVLMPGLIDCHTHLGMTFLRGFGDDKDLLHWLQQDIWPAEGKFVSPEFVRAGAQLGLVELLKSGTTCVNDAYFMARSTIESLMAVGVRGVVGAPVFDVPDVPSGEKMLAGNVKTIEEWNVERAQHADDKKYSLINFSIAPHAPYTVGDSTLAKCLEAAQQFDIPIHMHIHETANEVDHSVQQKRDSPSCHRSEKKISPLENLDEIGLTKHKLICAHMTNIREGAQWDIVTNNKSFVKIAHCPCSNMKLASGFCQTHRLVQSGVDVGIGTDSSASNNSLDYFGEMKMAALIAKGSTGDPTALPAYTVLRMATILAARTIFLDKVCGSLEKEKKADFIAVNLSGACSLPLYDVVSHLVYASTRDMVEYVWVNGESVMDNKVIHSNLEQQSKADALHWNKILLDFKIEAAKLAAEEEDAE